MLDAESYSTGVSKRWKEVVAGLLCVRDAHGFRQQRLRLPLVYTPLWYSVFDT